MAPKTSTSPPPECPAHGAEWPRATKNVKQKKLKFTREQPNVDELIEKHETKIASLRAALQDDERFVQGGVDRVPYDDLWLLRFILSNPKAKDAEKAARQTLEYREQNADLLAKCAAGEEHPLHARMSKMSISEIYPMPTEAQEPVQLIRAGKSNIKKLMDVHTKDEVVEWMNYQKEQAFLRCDEATRSSRRLVKMVTVVDMHSQKFSDNDKRFYQALGKASKDSELFYPQLLEITVGINVPSYMSLLWPIAKAVMPKKTLAKFRICSAKDTVTQSAAMCPFATNVFQPETLVEFLGGSAPSTEVLGPVDRPRVPYDVALP